MAIAPVRVAPTVKQPESSGGGLGGIIGGILGGAATILTAGAAAPVVAATTAGTTAAAAGGATLGSVLGGVGAGMGIGSTLGSVVKPGEAGAQSNGGIPQPSQSDMGPIAKRLGSAPNPSQVTNDALEAASKVGLSQELLAPLLAARDYTSGKRRA